MSIRTLAQDIYDVLEKQRLPEKAVKEFSESLAKKLVSRMCEVRDRNTLRASNLGTPDRKLWYEINRPDLAAPLEGKTRLKFLFGDIIEELILFLVKQTGKHTVTGEQKEVDVYGVKGHKDCNIDGVVVDVKSANSRSFDKFKHHLLESDDPFGYLVQLSTYLEGSRLDPDVSVKGEGAFLAVDKELGEIVVDSYKKKDINYEQLVRDKNRMLAGAELPPRCYNPVADGASGNKRLAVQCSYCPFKKTCWSDANGGRGLRTFAYSKGPVFLTEVAREPNVPEIVE